MQIIHTEADGGNGGQPLRIISESLGLMHLGHSVTILCPKTAPLHTMANEAGLKVVTMPLKRKNWHNLMILRRWMHENRKYIDIINSHNSADTWLVAIANLMLANPIPLVRTRHASGAPRNNWATRWLLSKACSHVVTTGEALRKQLLEIGVPMLKSTSVPSGIDIKRFHPKDKKYARAHCGLSQEDFWLGVVSRLRPNKGHSILLRALARIDNQSIKLVIIGEGPNRLKLEQEIILLGLHNRVFMMGYQKNPEHWFPAFDISLSPSYDMEGIPQVVLQSMASCVPVIATNAGSTADVVIDGYTGILIPQCNELALYNAIIKLYDDNILRIRLAQQSYKYLHDYFTYELMLQKMERIFLNVIAQLNRLR